MVLEEINPAIDLKLISVDEVLRLIREKLSNTELVLTGHGVPKEIIEVANLATDLIEAKHWCNKGISGRLGIEF